MVMNDMENKNTSSTTNEGLKEIDKQTNPVIYVSMCAYCGNNMNHITCKVTG